MFCPNCGKKLKEIKSVSHYGSPVKLSQCNNCGGIWFDDLELFNLEEKEAKKIENIKLKNKKENPFNNKKEKCCPVCNSLLTQFKDENIPLEIDIEHCQKCGGFWMDAGETIKYMIYREKRIEEGSKEKKDILKEEKKEKLDQIIGKESPELLLKLKGEGGVFINDAKIEDMTWGKLIIKILAAGLTLFFIILEIRSLGDESDFFIAILRSILIFVALPALYLFKLLDYLGITTVYFYSKQYGAVKSENNLFQANLFYSAIYAIIFILAVIRLAEKIIG